MRKKAETTFYQKLYQAISEFNKATVHIVVYEAMITSLETLSSAFAVVDCAYVYAYYDLEEHIFSVSEKQKFLTGGYPGFQEDLQQLRQALASFSRCTARQAIQTIFQKLRSCDMLAENVLKRMFMDILGIFSAATWLDRIRISQWGQLSLSECHPAQQSGVGRTNVSGVCGYILQCVFHSLQK